MKLIPVMIKGKIHRLSERALELLNLEQVRIEDHPIAMQKLPPNLEILKIQKAEPVAKEVVEQVVEVKKNEAVTVESTEETKKRRRRRGTLGTKE